MPITQMSLHTLFLKGSTVVAYSGTGTPWTSASTTPFELGMNDDTGPRFVLTPPETTAITSGQPPFALMPQIVGLQSAGARTVQIPIQMRATDPEYLPALLTALRSEINQPLNFTDGTGLLVTYEAKSVRMNVLSGSFQETDRFWNDEDGLGVLRGVLTLQCTVGGDATETTLIASQSLTNAGSIALATQTGDWRYSFGQPLSISLTGGDISTNGAKVIYAANCQNAPFSSGSISNSLVTSSTSASTAAGTVDAAVTFVRRVRYLATITSPSSNLQVRVVVRLGSTAGAAIYTGGWIAPGTSTTIVDLGFVTLSNELLNDVDGAILTGQVQYRSTNGSATSGTLTRIYAVNYLTWAKVTTSATSGTTTIRLSNHLRQGRPGGDQALVVTSGVGITEIAAVQGTLPRAIQSTRLFLAWTNAGVYDSADSITVSATYYPVYETIGGS